MTLSAAGVVVLGSGWLIAVLLVVILWSQRTQRRVDIRPPHRPQEIAQSMRPVEALVDGWLVDGNAVEVLQNGDAFFSRLIDRIDAAQHHVHFETYVWWKGEICNRLGAALCRRAEDGVDVRLLLDAFGSMTIDDALLESMRDAGCRVVMYHPFRLRTLGRLNKRDHRKVVVVDGRIGFVFGQGIATRWEGDAQDADHCRDTGLELTGPVVARLQSAFARQWMEASEEVLIQTSYFPALEATGDIPVHVIASSPRGGVSEVALLFRLMLSSASREVWVQTPYFSPGLDVVALIVAAAGRGVDVRLMLPGEPTDVAWVRRSGQHLYERLLAAGVRIFEFRRTMLHQKILLVDGKWAHVGSTNFDERSFDINAELSVGVLDQGVVAELRSAFENDLQDADERLLDSWRTRSWLDRTIDRLAFAAHQQL
ncbi:MAG: phospholipase D-like domain-containing protein [Acidobacteriota bacterium]